MRTTVILGIIFVALFIGSIGALIASVGYMRGYSQGLDDAREIRKRVDCEFEYGHKKVSEVPADCYKYFDINAKR